MTSSRGVAAETGALLGGWRVGCGAGAAAPVAGAVRLLAGFGAVEEEEGEGGEAGVLRLMPPDGVARQIGLAGWGGEGVLAGALRRVGLEAPNGAPLTAFAALNLAAAALAPGRGFGWVPTGALVSELLAAGRAGGPARSELVRCGDGWLVARWREPGERDLFKAMLGGETEAVGVDEAEARAREAHLLVGAVRKPGTCAPELAADAFFDGAPGRRDRPRLVDWSVLWAGPWAAQRLRPDCAATVRVEHPRRRDGLLAWRRGRQWWRRLNRGKRLALVDAREPAGAERLQTAVASSDLLVTSMTPRALASLGFDDAWRRRHAPHLLHLELVAFEGPWSDAPGLGEHAAAQAGLLWSGDGASPRTPYPWADPLLGAAALLAARAWIASDSARGGRLRLSLESAASLALAT